MDEIFRVTSNPWDVFIAMTRWTVLIVDVNLAVEPLSAFIRGQPLQPDATWWGHVHPVRPRVSMVYSVGKGVYEFTKNHLMEITLTVKGSDETSGDLYPRWSA